MSFVTTLSILSALKAALLALELPEAYEDIADYPKAFTTVEIYRNENLVQALEDLLTYDDRVCLIVPAGDTHADQKKGTVVTTERETEFVLLIADRDYSKDRAELTGNAETPGVIALKDLVVDALTGQSLGIYGVAITPTSGDPLHLTNAEQQSQPGRDCWAQSFKTPAGLVRTDLGR